MIGDGAQIERRGAVDFTRPLVRALFRDMRLTFGAKGLFAFLWDLPDGWTVRLSHLAALGIEKRDALRARLRELENVGAVRLETLRGADGRVAGKKWVLFAPEGWAIACSLTPSTETRETRYSDNPTVDKARASGSPNLGIPGAKVLQKGTKVLQDTTTTCADTDVCAGGGVELLGVFLRAAGELSTADLTSRKRELARALNGASEDQARMAGEVLHAALASGTVDSLPGLALALCRRAARDQITPPRGHLQQKKLTAVASLRDQRKRLEALAGQRFMSENGEIAIVEPSCIIRTARGNLAGRGAIDALELIERGEWKPCRADEAA